MAKITDGILGGFSGTVGTVVGAQWRGVPYMGKKITNKVPAGEKVFNQPALFLKMIL